MPREPEFIAGPFSLCWGMAPVVAMQANVCGIVELQGPAHLVSKDAKLSSGETYPVRLREFEVKIVEGSGLKRDAVFHCFTKDLKPVPVVTDAKRYLLIGWSSFASKRLAVEPFDDFNYRAKTVPLSIEGGPRTLYALALLPTRQSQPANGQSDAGRAYLNAADVLANGAAPATLRQVTDGLSIVVPRSIEFDAIDGQAPYAWVCSVLGPVIEKVPQKTPLERLRIGGLLASWERPKEAMAYLRSLSGLFAELGFTSAAKVAGDLQADLNFVCRIDLLTGVDPDAVVDVVLQCPLLSSMALDSRLGKPSLENQQKVLKYIDDPDIHVRAQALRQFAGWYADSDRMRDSRSRWSDSANAEVIANEEGLRSYWRNKIAGPTPP